MSDGVPPISVALIEDHKVFAQTMQELLMHTGGGITCTGIYGSAEEALEAFPLAPPDVALVDIHLPRMSGIDCIAKLRDRCPGVACVVLTTFGDTGLIFEALKAGACGYLLKRTPALEVVAAIRQAHEGGAPMSPSIARQVVGFFHRRPGGPLADTLTGREREVIELLAAGAAYKAIAAELGVSVDTVRSHVKRIYEKLHVHSRTEAINRYRGD